MAFIKHGDVQITHIIEIDELTEKQKKSVDDSSKKIVKQSHDNADENTSGR